MAGHGTGCPISFGCAKCRVRAGGIANMDRRVYLGWVLTGRERPLTKQQRGTGVPRTLQKRVEYRCLTCGHVGWSRHHGCVDYAKKR